MLYGEILLESCCNRLDGRDGTGRLDGRDGRDGIGCNHLPTSVQSAAYVRAISCLRPVIICLRPCNHLLLMGLKRFENRPPNGSQTALKSILGPLGELLELSGKHPGGLSGTLGGLLETSWELSEPPETSSRPLGTSWSALGSLKTRSPM